MRKSISQACASPSKDSLTQKWDDGKYLDVKRAIMPEPDCTVTAASGRSGDILIIYRAHKTILSANSHFFKDAFKDDPNQDSVSLPIVDSHHVFPLLLHWMYNEGHADGLRGETRVRASFLGLKLGMVLFLSEMKLALAHESTATIIDYLRTAHDVLECKQISSALISVLARRIGDPLHQNDLYRLSSNLLSKVLRSFELDPLKLKNAGEFMDRYLAARERKYNEKIGLQKVNSLRQMVTNLKALQGVMLDLWAQPKGSNYQLHKQLLDVKEDFHDQIASGSSFDPRRFLRRNDLNRVKQAFNSSFGFDGAMERLKITSPSGTPLCTPLCTPLASPSREMASNSDESGYFGSKNLGADYACTASSSTPSIQLDSCEASDEENSGSRSDLKHLDGKSTHTLLHPGQEIQTLKRHGNENMAATISFLRGRRNSLPATPVFTSHSSSKSLHPNLSKSNSYMLTSGHESSHSKLTQPRSNPSIPDQIHPSFRSRSGDFSSISPSISESNELVSSSSQGNQHLGNHGGMRNSKPPVRRARIVLDSVSQSTLPRRGSI